MVTAHDPLSQPPLLLFNISCGLQYFFFSCGLQYQSTLTSLLAAITTVARPRYRRLQGTPREGGLAACPTTPPLHAYASTTYLAHTLNLQGRAHTHTQARSEHIQRAYSGGQEPGLTKWKSKWKSSFNSSQKSKCKSMIDLKFDVQKIRFDKQKYQISTRADRPKCELKIDFSGAANRVRTSNIAIAHQSAATCPGWDQTSI